VKPGNLEEKNTGLALQENVRERQIPAIEVWEEQFQRKYAGCTALSSSTQAL
jgi:hypothetical protein